MMLGVCRLILEICPGKSITEHGRMTRSWGQSLARFTNARLGDAQSRRRRSDQTGPWVRARAQVRLRSATPAYCQCLAAGCCLCQELSKRPCTPASWGPLGRAVPSWDTVGHCRGDPLDPCPINSAPKRQQAPSLGGVQIQHPGLRRALPAIASTYGASDS